MSGNQIRQPLPESLMKAIRATVASPDATAQEKFEAVVLIAHGYGLWAKETGLNPTGYAIPEEQWAAISEMLMAVPDGDVGKVNMALDWMNLGPSGYVPGAVS
jgi:hypothetical protein